jgi:hypothetical protein
MRSLVSGPANSPVVAACSKLVISYDLGISYAPQRLLIELSSRALQSREC